MTQVNQATLTGAWSIDELNPTPEGADLTQYDLVARSRDSATYPNETTANQKVSGNIIDARQSQTGFVRWSIGAVERLIPRTNTALGAKDGPYFATAVNLHQCGITGGDKYKIWYSTDHDSGNGGIYAATTDDLMDDTAVTDLGLQFDSTLTNMVGTQCETPQVVPVFNAAGTFQHFSMLGHNDSLGTSQSTWECTSTDGVSWTWQGIVIDVATNRPYLGNGHTGYARRLVYGDYEFALHLHGGLTADGEAGHGLAARRHGVIGEPFEILSREYNIDVATTNTWFTGGRRDSETVSTPMCIFDFNGQLYCLGRAGSGDSFTREQFLWVAPIALTHKINYLAAPTKLMGLADWYAYNFSYFQVVEVTTGGVVTVLFTGRQDASDTNQSIGSVQLKAK